jgi:hypothetical protein
MGRLAPDEWKPLIASSIICESLIGWARYQKLNDKKRLLTRFFPLMIGSILLLAGVILLAKRTGGNAYEPQILSTGLACWSIFALLMMRRFMFVTTKDFQLRADEEASNTVGIEDLLRVLRKIDEMGLHRQSRLASLLRIGISPHQRIENLQNYSTRSHKGLP